MPVTFEEALRIAASLGKAERSTSYGTPAIKLGGEPNGKSGGKLIARLKEDGDSLVVGTTYEERAEMISAQPNIYYITDHYLNAPWVLVRLSQVDSGALRDLLGRAMKLATSAAKPVRSRKRAP